MSKLDKLAEEYAIKAKIYDSSKDSFKAKLLGEKKEGEL